jgi:hypothetical protein
MSVVKLYRTQADVGKKAKPLGVVILYTPVNYASTLLRLLGISFEKSVVNKDSEISEEGRILVDGCGKVCSIIAEGIKDELVHVAYPGLLVGPPENYVYEEIPDEIDVPSHENIKHVISFMLEEARPIYLDVVISMKS